MVSTASRLLATLALLALLLLGGCGAEDTQTPSAQSANPGAAPDATLGPTPTPKAATRPLRILTLADDAGRQPGQGLPEAAEIKLASAYAEARGRDVELIPLADLTELIPALLDGRGDLIAANLTVTDKRKQRVAFTTPVAFVREAVIARAGEAPKDRQGFADKRIAVNGASAYLESFERIHALRFQPAFEIVPLPGERSEASLLDAVAKGEYDLTLLDGNSAEALLKGRNDLVVAFHLSRVRPIAWALRPDDGALLEDLNRFLGEHQLLPAHAARAVGDLPAIQQRGVLRVATRNNAATYFLWRGELLGFEYELARRFAKSQSVRLEVVVPPDRQALLDWLRDGHADIAAASLTITEQREGDGITLSRPYNQVSELLVTRADDEALQRIDQLTGRTIVVRRSSSYWGTLERLKASGIDFELKAAPETLETEEIIGRVASGEYDLTVADGHILDIELTWRDDIRAAFPLGEPRPHGWALRADNPKLKQAVDAFLKKEYRGTFYNLTYRKYFKSPKSIRQHVEQRADRGADGTLSPYDEWVRRYSAQYGRDWRLVTAQMYQESRFDPQAKSWVGALGLMQVMPKTAKELGLEDLRDPETGIHAGVKYLDWLARRFEPDLDVGERTWFTLAAYNAGIGHVRDARKLAKQKGWNPDQWFDNVERAMLLLAKKEYAKQARHGFVRGEEPVNYVRAIRDRFRAYVEITGEGPNLHQNDP